MTKYFIRAFLATFYTCLLKDCHLREYFYIVKSVERRN